MDGSLFTVVVGLFLVPDGNLTFVVMLCNMRCVGKSGKVFQTGKVKAFYLIFFFLRASQTKAPSNGYEYRYSHNTPVFVVSDHGEQT